MDQKVVGMGIIISTVLMCLFIVAGAMYLPSWGKFQLEPAETITVTGQATSQNKTQIAMFNAGVSAFNDDKDTAVAEMNKKISAIVDAVKTFGIQSVDIQTQNMSINQNQETYYEDGRQKTRPGQWNASSSLSIKLTNVDQASALADLLSKSGATNVYGPNFQMDNNSAAANALIADALKDASEKAAKMAESSGKKVGKLLSIAEGYTPVSTFNYAGGGYGGGGGGMETGTGTVTKTVTVTYELK